MNSPLDYLKKYCEDKQQAYLSEKPAKFFNEQFESMEDAVSKLSVSGLDKEAKEIWDKSAKESIDYSKEAFKRTLLAVNADLLAAFRYFNLGSETDKQVIQDRLRRYSLIDAKTISSQIDKIHSLGDILK